MSHGFKKLEVWKLAMKLADSVYDVTSNFPDSQRYSLVQQIQRSAVSVPSNIAEGSARSGKKEFTQFLYIARGSLAELETQIILAYARNYIPKSNYHALCESMTSINNMLAKLIKSQKPNTQDP